MYTRTTRASRGLTPRRTSSALSRTRREPQQQQHSASTKPLILLSHPPLLLHSFSHPSTLSPPLLCSLQACKGTVKVVVDGEYNRNRTRVIEIWNLCQVVNKNELSSERFDE